jgi:NAD(P)-dependent dehydrogenase (short-subunit alcohol dehydrogenase family)
MNKDLPKEFVEQETQKIWLKRFAEPEEISKFIMFLASDNNTFITGQTLIIDGGY